MANISNKFFVEAPKAIADKMPDGKDFAFFLSQNEHSITVLLISEQNMLWIYQKLKRKSTKDMGFLKEFGIKPTKPSTYLINY